MQCFFLITYFPIKSVVLVTNCIFSLGLLHCFPLILLFLPQKRIISQNFLCLGVFIFSSFFFFFFGVLMKICPLLILRISATLPLMVFLTEHDIKIYRTINLPNQIQSKKVKYSHCWGLGNAVCDLSSQYVNRVTICFHQISQEV